MQQSKNIIIQQLPTLRKLTTQAQTTHAATNVASVVGSVGTLMVDATAASVVSFSLIFFTATVSLEGTVIHTTPDTPTRFSYMNSSVIFNVDFKEIFEPQ